MRACVRTFDCLFVCLFVRALVHEGPIKGLMKTRDISVKRYSDTGYLREELTG